MARALGKAVLATLITLVVLESTITAFFLSLGAGRGHLLVSWIAFSILAVPASYVFGAVASAIITGRARPPD